MKFFSNKNMLFKLIVCLILCVTIFNVMLKLTVHAVCDAESHTEADGSPVTTNEGQDANGNTFQKVTHTYTDGCVMIENKTIDGLGTTTTETTWEYSDGTTSGTETSTEVATPTNNSDAKQSVAAQGGKLLQPIVDLLLTLGDGVMDVIQRAIVGTEGHITIDMTTTALTVIIGIIGILAGVLVIAAITALTLGAGALVSSIGGVVGGALTAIGGSGIVTTVIAIGTLAGALGAYNWAVDGLSSKFLPDITILPTYSVSPQEIFEGKLLIFDINFFNPKEVSIGNENGTEYYYYTDENGEEVRTSKQSSSSQLSTVISKWYYTIRNIALVIMMLVLIYVGIRMMLCSIASEKSKYKKMLGDWVISMCLVFVLHYIMVFAVNVNENIVDMMKAATEKNMSVVYIDLNDMDSTKKNLFIDFINRNDPLKEYLSEDESAFIWPTNLVGRMRILCQLHNGSSEYVGYAIAYIVLVLYTIFFTFTYLKRVLYMAFLTVIAPLVAMTYSIDKISDGKAQAFNTWLKEYIFNLLIQPVHLLLYMLLISMAFDLAGENIIYTLVAIGFMMPAEKLIRSMFGFEKAKTPGFLGGATGAALTMSGIQSLARLAGKGPGAQGGNKSAGKLDKSNDDPKGLYSRSADSGNGFDSLFANENNGNSTDDSGGVANGGDANPTPPDGLGGAVLLNGENGGNTPTSDSPGGAVLLNGGDGGNTPTSDASGGAVLPDGGNANPPDYEDIRLAEQNADPMDFLNEDEKKDYYIAKARANTTRDLADYSKVSGIEAKAAQRKTAHFQQERTNRRMLEESQRRQQEAQAEAARRQQEQEKSQRWSATAGRIVRGAISKEKIGSAIATTTKNATKLTGAVLGGAVGAAAGIASGDMNKVAQNMALGVTTGNSLGTATGNAVVGGVTSGIDRYKQGKTEYEKERYGEGYSQHHKTELDEKFKKDREARKFYERECSGELAGLTGKARKEQLDKIMEEAIQYRQYGVTDNTLIVKARNIDKSNRTSSNSIAAAMMASKVKDMKGIESYQKKLAEQVGTEKAARIAKDAAKIGGIYS